MVECFSKTNSMIDIGFKHCPQDANQVAHQLVKRGFETKDRLSWNGDSPEFILPFVISDVTLFSSK